jgi:hypothetical protein
MTHTTIRAVTGVALVALSACSIFDTNVQNPNAIEETALSDPASAPTQANGLNSAVTRMLTVVYGPNAVTSDEVTWVGSREYWGKLDAGDVSDPRNEYTDVAFAFAGEARWLSNYTVKRLEAFDSTLTLVDRADLARTYVYAAVAYITIGDNFDDFIFASDRTVPGAPVGEANMTQAYDQAITYLDKALPIATALTNVGVRDELRRQIYGLRARAKFSRAVWLTLRPARTTPASPLINDAGASADATSALGVMATGYRYRVTPTNANVGTNNIGSEMNSRLEIRAGGDYINPDVPGTRPIVGNAGIKLTDPVSGAMDPVIAAAINECCRGTSSNLLFPITLTSWKEMQLILAEAALQAANVPQMQIHINNVRAVDALPTWDGVTPAPLAMLQHERRVNLFLQNRRLPDLYRFGLKADRWLNTNTAYLKACFFPITAIERQSNPLAPQPIDAKPAYCP